MEGLLIFGSIFLIALSPLLLKLLVGWMLRIEERAALLKRIADGQDQQNQILTEIVGVLRVKNSGVDNPPGS